MPGRFVCEVILADGAEGGAATTGAGPIEASQCGCLIVNAGPGEGPARQRDRIALITDVECRFHGLVMSWGSRLRQARRGQKSDIGHQRSEIGGCQ